MKKNLVFQINVPNYYQKIKPSTYTYIKDMYYISERNARRYANKFNAGYYLLSDASDFQPAAGKHLDYQKLKIYDFLEYDQIIYMDCDYIIKDNAPDLFELCQDKFSVCIDTGKEIPTLANNLGIPVDYYFNAGFMYVTREVLDKTESLVKAYLKQDYEFDGQGLLNKMYFDAGIIPNRLNPADWNPVGKTFGTYADHYAGNKKKRWGEYNYGD